MRPPAPAAFTVDTAADGAFRLAALEPGTYMMGVLVPRQPVQLLSAVAAGASDVSVVFPVTGSLSGRVVRARTGEPVTRFRIRPQFAGQQNPVARFVTQRLGKVFGSVPFASDDGSFRFDRIGPGTYVLVVEAEGYPAIDSPPVTVEAAREVVAPPVSLPEGNVIAGVVRDAQGAPVADARVFARAGGRGEEVPIEEVAAVVEDMEPEARTDAQGAFRTRPLTPASYLLAVVAPARLPVMRPDVDVRHGDATGLDVAMPAGGVIQGKAVDAGGGTPGRSIDVLFCHADGDMLERHTNPDGRLEVGPLRPGRWLVAYAGLAVVAASGEEDVGPRLERLRAIPNSLEVDVRDGAVHDVIVRIPRLAVVRGRVRVAGRVAAGTVVFSAPGGYEAEAVASDVEGRYVALRIEPGTYTVYFRLHDGPNDRWLASGPRVVPDVADQTLDVDFP
jgi:hypothetical protein